MLRIQPCNRSLNPEHRYYCFYCLSLHGNQVRCSGRLSRQPVSLTNCTSIILYDGSHALLHSICFSLTQRAWMYMYNNHTVIMTEAFLYQLSNGFSPLLVSVSSTYAQRFRKSRCEWTRVSFPVTAR